jgi:hypothetical protein
MSVALSYDLKEMLFGVEVTLVSGFVFLLGLFVGVSVLWAFGLVGGLFGFWLTVDAYAGTDAQTPGSEASGAEESD